jgi:hypothetical protein
MFHVPEKHRITNHPFLKSDASFGNNGAFEIPLSKDITAFVIASDGMSWEHVSVHISEDGKEETPTWEEMCQIKSMFWDEEDCVIQYHPAKSEYVNNHPHVLHMWRPTDQVIPIPDSTMVGIK